MIEIRKTEAFVQWLDGLVIVLLAGGDKSTQAEDIRTAIRLARNL